MIAIDLGSNTLRCVQYDCLKQRFGDSFEAVVKTADGLHTTHFINEEAVQRIIAALQDAKRTLDFTANEVFAVTTAAMRLAHNSTDVIEQIYTETGVKFDIISGYDEAKLTILAVSKRLEILQMNATSFVLVDIGGGSTEITFYEKSQITTASFDIGIVTLTQMLQKIEDIEDTLDTLCQDIVGYVDGYYAKHPKPDIFIQTAGTPTTMAAYLQGMKYATYDASKINGYRLHLKECDKVMNELLDMDWQTRSSYVGTGREDLIITGIAIVKRIYKILGFTDSIVIDDSLREGVAFWACEEPK
jgi:exopolyphosphatase / guanosine-5'-triphosphate,3'-diphosphate pyrophosphatase